MLKFVNGTTLSFQEAADKIRAEKYGLIVGSVIDGDGHRCAMGVLVDSTLEEAVPVAWVPTSIFLLGDIIAINNEFDGTPPDRREHVARWLEDQCLHANIT